MKNPENNENLELEAVKSDAPAAKTDATPVKADATSVKPDATAVKADASAVKPDATPAKPDATAAKPDATAAKADATPAKADATAVKTDATPVKADASAVKTDATPVKADASAEPTAPELVPVDGVNPDAKFILTLTWKLLVISAVTALMLSCVNALTADRIAANAEAEKAAAIQAIFSEADSSGRSEAIFEGIDELYLVMAGDDMIGYAASVSPLGFGGEFSLMVGIRADGTVAGIQVVSHSETPGLGSRVGDESFLSQFRGKSGQLALGRDVDAITGSTVSSRAILEGVNNAAAIHADVFGGAR